ncbi:MAG: acetyl-CoA carboxylase biotin carboxyl carrier protein [Pseudomonadota bacterium]
MAKPTSESDVAFVEAMAEILAKHDLAELEVERGNKEDGRLILRLSKTGKLVKQRAPAVQPIVAMPDAAAAPAQAQSADAPAATDSEDPAALPGAVTSPMVGTVYLSPEPNTRPFVSVGESVSEGQTLLIVEAMKTMNQIPAPRAGVVKRILVEDASPVEFGAPLMVIE